MKFRERGRERRRERPPREEGDLFEVFIAAFTVPTVIRRFFFVFSYFGGFFIIFFHFLISCSSIYCICRNIHFLNSS